MSRYYSLFGGTTTDTEIQVAQENQIVIGFGPYMSQERYVIVGSSTRHTDKLHSWRLSETDNRTLGSARQICISLQTPCFMFSSGSIPLVEYP